jgi:glucose-6-phosphate isomerase
LVSYALSGTGRTLQPNTNETFFVARGSVVNLTAQPSSLFYVFSGWTGDLAGTGASGSLTVDQPLSVGARFSLNWSFIAALITIIGIAVVASLVFLIRRRRRVRPSQEQAPPPAPPPPPSGPNP